MIKKLLFITLLAASLCARADEGDTIVVQTIDFNTPVNPGWNQPREGYFVFPPDSLSFSKILMYHTLKCDPSQSPACGEWDYTTHNYLWHHTGEIDSNVYYHSNFRVYRSEPDSFMYMDDVSWKYRPWLEYSNYTPPALTAEIGVSSGTIALNDPASGEDNGRQQYLFTAAELAASGITAGDLIGIQLSLVSTGETLKKFTVKAGHTILNNIGPSSFVNDSLLTVYQSRHAFDQAGWQHIPFAFPFNYDGTSNLVIDISFAGDQSTDPILLDAGPAGFDAAVASFATNNCLYFHQGDNIVVPVNGIQALDSAVTISFWQYGNWQQPLNNSVLEGLNAGGKRVINIHLPWSNGSVYWDCGTDGSYDRINKAAAAESYMGHWNHWAFTKDVSSGEMKIFLNGELFHSGSGKTKTMSGISRFRIGSSGNDNNFYEGMIDELRIFDVTLDQQTIRDWMNRVLYAAHPAYNRLVAYFDFDEGQGFETLDKSSFGVRGELAGYPGWTDYKGSGRVMNFTSIDRPVVRLEQGTYNPLILDSLVRVDTIAHDRVMLVMYEDPDDPTFPTDTLSPWPHYYNDFVFDAGGNAIDSSLVPPDHILYKVENPYYVPYEVIDKYELGRFITPYGIGLSLGDGFTWVYDVTDFRQFLHDTVHLSAGNFQELLDLDFHMIEGIPPRDVVSIDRMWHGYWPLNNFETSVPPLSLPLHPDAEMFKLKVTTSGHEFDNATNCAEFCQKTHWVDVNGETSYEWEILDECADNALYPQGGTWIYDRAGWCPGAKVSERNLELSNYIPSGSDSVTIDYNCDYDQYGRYSVSSYLISYGAPNFTLDAAVDEIVRPNIMKRYGRTNPMCSRPEIVIQNTGSETLSTLDIVYGPQTANAQVFHWEGSLEFMEKERVVLDPIDWTGWQNGHNTFTVTVENPNGGTDEYPYNSSMNAKFALSPEFPEWFIIKFKTNSVAYQNYYEILDADGNIVHYRDDFTNSTVHEDTIFLADGCYTFILHDSGDNGISFWANNQGSGYIYFKKMDGTGLHSFKSDFGKFTQIDFTVGLAVDIQEQAGTEILEIYPNPSNGRFNIEYTFEQAVEMQVDIYDSRGQLLKQINAGKTQTGMITADMSEYPAGMYFISVRRGEIITVEKMIRY